MLFSRLKQKPILEEGHRVRGRTFLFGALLILPLLYWQLQLEMKRYSFPTWAVPFYHVIFVLWWLALANLLVQRKWPQLAFTGGELAILYVMLSIAAALFSVDLMCIIVATIAYPFHVPTPANEHLPHWLVVTDEAALKGYYLGHSTLYRWEHLRAWATPLAAWSALLLVLILVMLCINILLRRQWTERERLSYPIIHLPLGLAADTRSFLKQRALWVGFGIAALITLINGLQFWFPTLITIPVKRYDLRRVITQRPWNAIGWTCWSMYPFAIGLSFFIPVDLSFSIWVFFLIHKAEMVAASAAGFEGTTDFPYPHQQATGAYLAILLVALWMGRGHLREVVQAALGREASTEAREWRYALVGLVAGLAFLFAFATAAGMPPLVALAFFGLYLAIVVMITRIRVELGFPVHDLGGAGPHHTLVAVAGTPALGTGGLVGMGLMYGLVRRFTSHPMPHQLEGYKMAQATGTPLRSMTLAILLAAAVGIFGGFWLFLDRYYAIGAESAYWNGWTWWLGREAFNTLNGWLSNPREAEAGARIALGFGFFFSLFLSALRLRMGNFPLHPLAYAVAPSWGMGNLWSCVFLAWLAKVILLRYGGLKAYRRAGPFFLGLILGEFIVGAGWTLLGVLTNQPTFDFWP